ncbi:hypothetical protein B0A48_09695 [Cryoendolithus antarcticus]|uniref:ubiquitinyl hydrolase 1 n=1 Tax=Cryoendolithus antarcticus TaxID=1507870 RepID=A0A1V8T0H7_9PEZI|nr:hypothetical protein B0A48_09695 [Cryoendolithus antarcticus]
MPLLVEPGRRDSGVSRTSTQVFSLDGAASEYDESPRKRQRASCVVATAQPPEHFRGIFTADDGHHRKSDKEDDKKAKAILARVHGYGIDNISESNIEYALRAPSVDGDMEEAFRLLMLLEDTYEGIVRPYSPDAKLLGAVNREGVTCFLDALLFSMFARLDSFEALLYEGFEDLPRRRLAGMLRLWVNMLRTGRLITTDITKRLQSALAECGWDDAIELVQQDPSEAFGFITGQLELPLLTLKMDLYHTGKENPADDHKFINERLLEVAIPDEPAEGAGVMTLEHCLEQYFNNRIEVKRHLEAVRRNTLQGAKQDEVKAFSEKQYEAGLHVEVAELETPLTPLVSTPIGETPTQSKNPLDRVRPGTGRKRADSIFSQRRVELIGVEPDAKTVDDAGSTKDVKLRKLSTRTEVLMPAWQFFKLLPWYTDHLPTSDAQVAAHFSRKRPVLGICFKRYSFTANGHATRRETYVDIPLEITVPNFVGDDNMEDREGPIGGNFRLLLQSIVCHRGNSVHSGHYICLSRGQAANAKGQQHRPGSDSSADDVQDPWMRFDDLARERISYVDIHEALKHETPYLLFYQVQPIDDDGEPIHDLPSYAEATSRSHSDAAPPPEKLQLLTSAHSDATLAQISSDPNTEATDFAPKPASTRTSLDIPGRERIRTSLSFPRRSSLALDDGLIGVSSDNSVRTDSIATSSIPVTPSEEKGNAFLNAAKNFSNSRRGSRVSGKQDSPRSRPVSTGPAGEGSGRFSLNMTKLTARMSRNDLASTETATKPSESSKAEPGAAPAQTAPTQGQTITQPSDADDSNVTPALKPLPAPASATMQPPAMQGKGKKDKEKKHKHHHGKDGEERDCSVM